MKVINIIKSNLPSKKPNNGSTIDNVIVISYGCSFFKSNFSSVATNIFAAQLVFGPTKNFFFTKYGIFLNLRILFWTKLYTSSHQLKESLRPTPSRYLKLKIYFIFFWVSILSPTYKTSCFISLFLQRLIRFCQTQFFVCPTFDFFPAFLHFFDHFLTGAQNFYFWCYKIWKKIHNLLRLSQVLLEA